jgi:hypothetical protein
MVSDELKGLLLSDNPLLKVPLKLLEACFCAWEACWMWVPFLTIIIRFLPDIVDHILGWRWENVIQRKVAVATMHRQLGTICAVGLMATINHPKKDWVAEFNRRLYPSGSSNVINAWGNIMCVRTTISIWLLQAAPKLTDFLAGVWQTGDCSIHDGHIWRIND